MTYKLKFLPSAQKEWEKLDDSIKTPFKKKLAKCLENPYMKSMIMKLLAVGKRENNAVYEITEQRKS